MSTRRGQHLAITDYPGTPNKTSQNVTILGTEGNAATAFESRTVTIANGATVSSAVAVGALDSAALAGLVTPTAWTTADITFQAGLTSGGTFYDLQNVTGTVIKILALAADKWVALDPADFAGVPWVKLKSSVAQSGGDIVTLICRTV